MPAAYAKPAPVDPSYLRRQPRDTVLASMAGPLTNLALATLAGLAARAFLSGPTINETGIALVVLAYTNASLFVFHLLPIPGLDGARMVALLLPPTIRDTYRNFDRYLPLDDPPRALPDRAAPSSTCSWARCATRRWGSAASR